MQKLVLVCDDIFGLEIFSYIENGNKYLLENKIPLECEVIGYLSEKPDIFGDVSSPIPYLGKAEEYSFSSDVRVVLGVKEPSRKRTLVELLKSKNAMFYTYVWPCMIARALTPGEGSFIAGYSAKAGLEIGSFVTVIASMISGGRIGDYSTTLRFANVAGNVGADALVDNHVFIPVGKEVSDNATVLTGGIVVKNVKPGFVVAGVPARKV